MGNKTTIHARWRLAAERSALSLAHRKRSIRWRVLRVALLSMMVLSVRALLGLLIPLTSASVLHADANPTLTITHPTPDGSRAEGPVGANITVQAQGAVAGDSYLLGYSTHDSGCSNVFTPITSVQPQPADSTGSFLITFSWPQSANSVGTSYYVCAQDQTNPSNPVVQSQQVFQVDSGSGPVLSSAQAASGPGTPTVTPSPAPNVLVRGGEAQLTGQNFFPGNDRLYVFLTQAPFTAADYAPDQSLKKPDGSDIMSDIDGGLNVSVVLPENAQPGSYYLTAVSADGGNGSLPTLVSNSLQVTIQDAATPTPTATATPIATTIPTPAPAKAPSGPSAGAVAGLVGLGALSLILFVIGIILLASAASMPRPQV